MLGWGCWPGNGELLGRGAFLPAVFWGEETQGSAGWAPCSWQQTAPGGEGIMVAGRHGEDRRGLAACGGWWLEGMGQSKPWRFLRKQRPEL